VRPRAVTVLAARDGATAAAVARTLAAMGSFTCEGGDAYAAQAGSRVRRAEAVLVLGSASADPHVRGLVEDALSRHVPVLCLGADDAGEPIVARAPADAPPEFVAGMLLGLLERQTDLDRMRREAIAANASSGDLRAEVNRITDELQLASSVQRDFLPRSLPTLGSVRMGALWKPAEFVSGDLYNVMRLDEHRLGVFITDAVGHGVPAALMTLVIGRALPTKDIAGNAYRLLSPAESLERLNAEMLARSEHASRFATAVYAVIDVQSGHVRFSCAGHPPVLLARAGGGFEPHGTTGGLLGVFEGTTFGEAELELAPGDRLLLYSDGFEQAFPDAAVLRQKHRLPNDRYLQSFARHRGLSEAQAFCDAVSRETDEACAGTPLHDDVTLVCIDRQ
jgi:sigma-B regulation protein RsbU (phosphoserine phosphatase)